MKDTRFVSALIVVATTSLIAAGCGGDDEEETATSPGATATQPVDLGLIQDGTLLVATDTPFPPFEMGQPPDISGYDVDVMDAIAEILGVETEYEDTTFDTIFRDTAQGRYDIVASATAITRGRERAVDFSDPYYDGQQALVVTAGSEIGSLADLSGRVVGTQDGTTGESYANDQTEAGEVRGFPEGPDAFAALETGQVDAVIIDQPVAVDAVEKQGGVEIVEEISTSELYGFAMAPGNDALREAVNEALTTLKEDGTLAELYEQYFSTAPPKSVLSGTHEPTT